MLSFWNKLATLPEGHFYSRILRDSLLLWSHHSLTLLGGGSFMVDIRSIGYRYPIDCRMSHSIDMDTFRGL